jgi:GTPase SAR1 family protein
MHLVNPLRKVPCPFCFHRFHLHYASLRDGSRDAEPEVDVKLARFLNETNNKLMLPAVRDFERPSRLRDIPLSILQRSVLFEDISGRWIKVCPNCHLSLPPKTASGELSSEVIAVIGARHSGKSNFIGVVLRKLAQMFATWNLHDGANYDMSDQDTYSVTHQDFVSSNVVYQRRYGDRLFGSDDRMVVDPTPPARLGAQDTRIPLIFRLVFPKRPWHYLTRPLASASAVDLIIFDPAGEDMTDRRLMELHYSYILGATGIIFVIDPTQFDGVRDRLPESVQDRLLKVNQRPEDVVATVIRLYEARRGLGATGKINIPVAFALSKSDLFSHIVNKSSKILNESRHVGGFNSRDCAEASEEVETIIKNLDPDELGENSQLNALLGKAKRFRCSKFFAFSALGGLPDTENRINSVRPLRVADPLLWILWKRGYLRTADTDGDGLL